MFELLIDVLHSMAVSIGVGASTLAIVFYFCSIGDGQIDEGERRSLGIIYVVLRVAMVLILLFFSAISIIVYNYLGIDALLSSSILFEWLLIFVLYANAILMTLHIMPMKIGPALQASTWYSLGITVALLPLTLPLTTYLGLYAGFALFVIVLVEIILRIIQRRSKGG